MNILITGGAGFVGSNLAFHLSRNHHVTVMDNLVRRGSEINIPLFKYYKVNFIHGDIRNVCDFNHLKDDPDLILQVAAQTSACTGYDNSTFDIHNNFDGNLNVLTYAKLKKSKMIFWSTNKVYSGDRINALKYTEKSTRYHCSQLIPETFSIDGGSHSIYGLSKVCADLMCQEWAKAFDIPIIINRFSCLAGPGQFGKSEQGWVTWFVIAAILGLPVTLYGFKGKQVRDCLFMPDIISLIDNQIARINDFRGEVFNVGGAEFCNTSLIECLNLLEKLLGKKLKWGYDEKQRKADQRHYISDITKVRRTFNWKPMMGMTDGLVDIIDWVKKNEAQLKELYEPGTIKS